MLDKDTRQTIDNARDILVGKVPNPVTQIDLITTAMIYKFMDDMDLENISFGGERVFFVGDLEQYSWSKLLSAAVGNSERISLYTQALEKLPYARQIPQLFRSIFKDAFLPFRDGATLTLFLNEINSLSYNNSENLGDGFEYLLSVMGSQGDAGQFRTPRHIIDFIVEAVNPGKDDVILDPACGTAGFLISAYKHIIKTANEQKKTLSVDAIRQIAQNITGYDIDPTMQKLSLVNLYLHNFAAPKVYEYDTLTSEDRWGDKFDVILANPPFMTPKGGIRPHNRFGIRANKSEVLFVDYFMEHLTLNGRAGFVVPEGIIFQSAAAYRNLRRMMVEDNYLYAVVSLPAGVFNPYSGVKTSVLFFDRQLAKKTDKILFAEVKNDGFDLGAQRRPIKENDLPAALQAIREYQKSYNKADLKLPDNCLLVEKSRIAGNGDYNLTAGRYKQTAQVINSKWEMVKLGEVCEIKRGNSLTKKDAVDGDIPVIAGGQQPAYYHNQYNRQGECITVAGSGAYAGYIGYHNTPIFVSDAFTIIPKDSSQLLTKFLYHLLKNQQDSIYAKQTGIGVPHIYPKDFAVIQIPLPPLEVQEEIVKELECYQAIINGSQEIIDNWKPYFAINPNWPKVKLGDVLETTSGGTPLKSKKEYYEPQEVGWINSGELKEKNITKAEKFISKLGLENSSAKIIPADSVLVAMYGATAGQVSILSIPASTNQAVCAILPDKKILPEFLYYVLNSKKDLMIGMCVGGAQPNISQTIIKQLEIPLPSLAEQKAVVDKIEFEEKYINTCKEYIAHYKQKIADKIQTIWSSK